MKTFPRTLAGTVVAAALVALAAGVASASGTFGGTLSLPPSIEIGSEVTVISTSTDPIAVQIEFPDDTSTGWTVTESEFLLDPLARYAVAITGIGPERTTIRATLSLLTATGTDTPRIVLEKGIEGPPRWVEALTWTFWLAVCLLAGILLGLAVRMRGSGR